MSNYDFAPTGGSCSGKDVQLWFPSIKKGGMNPSEKKQKIANDTYVAQVCGGCKVQEHCLEYSLRHEPFGTWGGKNESQRADIRNKRGIVLSGYIKNVSYSAGVIINNYDYAKTDIS